MCACVYTNTTYIFPTSKASFSLFMMKCATPIHRRRERSVVRPNLQRTLLWGKFHEAKQARKEGEPPSPSWSSPSWSSPSPWISCECVSRPQRLLLSPSFPYSPGGHSHIMSSKFRAFRTPHPLSPCYCQTHTTYQYSSLLHPLVRTSYANVPLCHRRWEGEGGREKRGFNFMVLTERS